MILGGWGHPETITQLRVELPPDLSYIWSALCAVKETSWWSALPVSPGSFLSTYMRLGIDFISFTFLIVSNLLSFESWMGGLFAKRSALYVIVNFQPIGRKYFSTPDCWRLKRKTQEFCGAPVRFDRGHPKCIDFAYFRLWLVPLSSIDWTRRCTSQKIFKIC